MPGLDTLERPIAKGKQDWKLGPIVDADAHIDPPYSMWRDYLPAHLKDRGPQIEEGDDCDFATSGILARTEVINSESITLRIFVPKRIVINRILCLLD